MATPDYDTLTIACKADDLDTPKYNSSLFSDTGPDQEINTSFLLGHTVATGQRAVVDFLLPYDDRSSPYGAMSAIIKRPNPAMVQVLRNHFGGERFASQHVHHLTSFVGGPCGKRAAVAGATADMVKTAETIRVLFQNGARLGDDFFALSSAVRSQPLDAVSAILGQGGDFYLDTAEVAIQTAPTRKQRVVEHPDVFIDDSLEVVQLLLGSSKLTYKSHHCVAPADVIRAAEETECGKAIKEVVRKWGAEAALKYGPNGTD